MNVTRLQTPALIVDLDAFEANVKAMDALIAGTHIRLRPHYKSNKCTAIAHMQIRNGAKGITCAKLGEAADLVDAGIEDVLIANQVVDKNKIAQVAYLAGCCKLTVAVDQAENIKDLSDAAVYQGSTIYCLVEYEIGMQRCGVKTPEAFYALARQIENAPGLVFKGIQAYAGNLSHEVDYGVRKQQSGVVEKRLGDLIGYLKDKGISVREVSGVSTGTIQFRGNDTVYTEVQPGSYIFMDAAYNLLGLGFKNALFVLTAVVSVNDDFVMTDAGLKTIGTDQHKPCLVEAPGIDFSLGEEHLCVPRSALPNARVGDRLNVIPGHCCTTVNLHSSLYFVRSGRVVDKVPVTSRGKSL